MFGYRDIIEESMFERLMTLDEDEIPVIIRAENCDCADLEKCVKDKGGRIKYLLPLINSVAAYLPSVGVRSVAREQFINKIIYDDLAHKLMDVASLTVGSDYANESDLTGKGVTVAVIDTGVYPHSDLITPTNRIIGFKDFVGKKTSPYDDDGHGTHVAGIVAGNGFSSQGKYMGIAPDANILGIKVLNQDGGGSISDVIAGIQWAVDNRSRYNVKVMTLSLGTKAKKSHWEDPLCQAVEAAVNAGITVVTAAGNSGPERSTINSPANSPSVISVGAIDDRDITSPKDAKIADFSSRGPTPDGLTKPDILSPGVRIHSLGHEGNQYTSLSGTSMATPIVAGCAALLYEQNPSLTPQGVKSLMTKHALNIGQNRDAQGAGILDIRKILKDTNPIHQKPGGMPSRPVKTPQRNRSFFSDWFLVLLIVLLLIVL